MDGKCEVLLCGEDATRRLTIAMETTFVSLPLGPELQSPRLCIETCQKHGDALDEGGPHRYLVMESHPNGWTVEPDQV